MRDDHLQPKIEYDIVDVADDHRRVTFRMQPGPRYDKVVLAFEGASGIDPDQLDKIIDQQNLERQLFTDPVVVTELLQRYYREQGFLAAEIDAPRLEFQGTDRARGARQSAKVRASSSARSRRRGTPSIRLLPWCRSCRSYPASRSCRLPPSTRSSGSASCTGGRATTTCGPTTRSWSIAPRDASTSPSTSPKAGRASSRRS